MQTEKSAFNAICGFLCEYSVSLLLLQIGCPILCAHWSQKSVSNKSMTSILNVYNSHKCHAYVSIACVRLYIFNSLPKMVRFYALICFDFSFQFISIKFVKSRPTDSFKSFDTRTHSNKHPLVAQTHTHTYTCVCTAQVSMTASNSV